VDPGPLELFALIAGGLSLAALVAASAWYLLIVSVVVILKVFSLLPFVGGRFSSLCATIIDRFFNLHKRRKQ
jgi:hypothetical protein